MSVDVLTFGCRLNTYESEVIRREAAAAGLADVVVVNTCAVTAEAERQARQAIRRAQARAAAGAHHRDRMRGADRSGALRRHGGGRSRHRQRRQDHRGSLVGGGRGARAAARLRHRPRREDRRQRHHVGARDRRPSDRRPRRQEPAPSSRCRTAAIIAAPSASFRSGAARRARCRWARWSRQVRAPRRQRLSRSGAHRRRPHELRRRPAGHAAARHAGAADPAPRRRTWRGCGSPRSTASRSTTSCSPPSPRSRA